MSQPFSTWIRWIERNQLGETLKFHGVYAIALSDKDLTSTPFEWSEGDHLHRHDKRERRSEPNSMTRRNLRKIDNSEPRASLLPGSARKKRWRATHSKTLRV